MERKVKVKKWEERRKKLEESKYTALVNNCVNTIYNFYVNG